MPYPNYYSPYVNQFVQPQMQPQMQNNPVNKVVDSLEAVRSADIPMDGSAYYFPKADGSAIYSKRWLPNCTTQITAYMPQNIPESNKLTDVNTEQGFGANLEVTDLYQRIDSLEEKIDMLLGRVNNESKSIAKSSNTKQSTNAKSDG